MNVTVRSSEKMLSCGHTNYTLPQNTKLNTDFIMSAEVPWNFRQRLWLYDLVSNCHFAIQSPIDYITVRNYNFEKKRSGGGEWVYTSGITRDRLSEIIY